MPLPATAASTRPPSAAPIAGGILFLACTQEAIFLRMLSLGDLKQGASDVIVLLLASGLFYLIWWFLVSGSAFPDGKSGRRARTRFILISALLYRATVWPLAPGLSDDVFRYRWEGM